ncbi:RNA polymerase sigma factor [Thalassotalea atypica]|uniref:RNA polymerase sigma factor n=1 Tax=Thalassotalea atypica TaxID=2054316 RepID=UPI0025744602|nr:sigma-70 family RNA polymerase sigma factor [Thalassotalea atypica]
MSKQGFGQALTRQEFTMLQKGKHSGFDAAYHLYADHVYSLSLHLVCDEQQAADILQQVFEILLRKRASIKQPDALGSWLKRCTINECTDYFRRINKESSYQSTVDVQQAASSLLDEQASIDDTKTAQLINELPVAQRSIVYLHTVQNLKHKEIAQQLGVKDTSVRQNYRRALSKLKKWLTR